MLSDEAEEILESLWTAKTEKNQPSLTWEILGKKPDSAEIKELVTAKLVTINDKEIKLTVPGEKEGIDIVRRHRLAERLLVDVIAVEGQLIHQTACEFEHHLHPGIEDNICTLLGHPKMCPHGRTIPPGKCCLGKEPSIKVVSSLDKLNPGQKGKIAYLQAQDQTKLQKMMAMGVIPGQPVTLLQNFPSYLFTVGNTQFAVDESIATDIYVRIEN